MGITHVIRGRGVATEHGAPRFAVSRLRLGGHDAAIRAPAAHHEPRGQRQLLETRRREIRDACVPDGLDAARIARDFPRFSRRGVFAGGAHQLPCLARFTPAATKKFFGGRTDCRLQTFLDHIHKSGARFDYDKAKWFNQKYIQALPNDELARLIQPHAEAAGYTTDLAYLEKVAGLMKERATFLHRLFTRRGYCVRATERLTRTRWQKNGRPKNSLFFNDLHHSSGLRAVPSRRTRTGREKLDARKQPETRRHHAPAAPRVGWHDEGASGV